MPSHVPSVVYTSPPGSAPSLGFEVLLGRGEGAWVRLAAGAILLASLAWFVALVAFLRWARATGPGAQGTPPA